MEGLILVCLFDDPKIKFANFDYIGVNTLEVMTKHLKHFPEFPTEFTCFCFCLRLHASYGAKITEKSDPPGSFCLNFFKWSELPILLKNVLV